MGVAAYNRGSAVISRQLDAAQPSAEIQILRDLTAYSASHDGVVAFQPTVIRFGPRACEVSLMNRRERGWGERSYTYDSVWDLARHWRLTFLSFGHDKHSRYIEVVPGSPSESVGCTGV